MATTSWSNGHPRAVATVWWTSVAVPKGSSCFGWPSRFEPPAARTSPATNASLAGMAHGVGGVRGAAALAAEVDGRAVVLEAGRRVRDQDLHAADRVDRGCRRFRRRRWRDALAADADDLGEDRQRDLLRGVGADVEAGRRVHALAQGVVDVERGEDRRAAAAARDEPDVRDAVAQRVL